MGFSIDGPTFQQIDTVEKWNKIYGSAASEGMLHSALAYNLSWRLSCAQFLHDLTQRSVLRVHACARSCGDLCGVVRPLGCDEEPAFELSHQLCV